MLAGPAAAADPVVSGLTFTPAGPPAATYQNLTFHVDLNNGSDHVKDLQIDLPPGVIGDPHDVPQCLQTTFDTGTCSGLAQVGATTVNITALGMPQSVNGQVYLLVPQPGEAARLGILLPSSATSGFADPVRTIVSVHVRNNGAYLSNLVKDPPKQAKLVGGLVPVDITINSIDTTLYAMTSGGKHFALMPPNCTELQGSASADSYAAPGTFQLAPATGKITPTNCLAVPFHPTLALTRTTSQAGAPTGLTLTIAQPGGINPSESPISDSAVRLPTGLALNGALLPTLASCTDAQFAVASEAAATCPAASKLGTVAIDSPPLGTLSGNVYFSSESGALRTLIEVVDTRSTTRIKLVGTTAIDGATNQVVASLHNLPPAPVTRFVLSFHGTTATAPAVFKNPCTPTAAGSATLTAFSGPVKTVPTSIATTGSCPSAPPPAGTPPGSTPPGANPPGTPGKPQIHHHPRLRLRYFGLNHRRVRGIHHRRFHFRLYDNHQRLHRVVISIRRGGVHGRYMGRTHRFTITRKRYVTIYLRRHPRLRRGSYVAILVARDSQGKRVRRVTRFRLR